MPGSGDSPTVGRRTSTWTSTSPVVQAGKPQEERSAPLQGLPPLGPSIGSPTAQRGAGQQMGRALQQSIAKASLLKARQTQRPPWVDTLLQTQVDGHDENFSEYLASTSRGLAILQEMMAVAGPDGAPPPALKATVRALRVEFARYALSAGFPAATCDLDLLLHFEGACSRVTDPLARTELMTGLRELLHEQAQRAAESDMLGWQHVAAIKKCGPDERAVLACLEDFSRYDTVRMAFAQHLLGGSARPAMSELDLLMRFDAGLRRVPSTPRLHARFVWGVYEMLQRAARTARDSRDPLSEMLRKVVADLDALGDGLSTAAVESRVLGYVQASRSTVEGHRNTREAAPARDR